MNPSCPDCNFELTPSIIGYLCANCGNSHSFAKISNIRAHGVSHAQNSVTSKPTRTRRLNQKSSRKASKTPGKIHQTFHKFFVPKID